MKNFWVHGKAILSKTAIKKDMATVIEAITNSGIKYDEEDEVVNVCQAIQEIRMEERKIGEQDGELKKAKEAAKNFYNLGVDVEKIAQGVGYAVETVKVSFLCCNLH